GSPPRAPRAARAGPDAGGGSVPAVLSGPLPMDTGAPRSPGVARAFRGAPGTLDPSPSPDLLLLVHDLVVRFDHVLVVRCARGATGRGPLLGGRARPGLGLALRGLRLVHLLACRAEGLHELVPRRVQRREVVALERFLGAGDGGFDALLCRGGDLLPPLGGVSLHLIDEGVQLI